MVSMKTDVKKGVTEILTEVTKGGMPRSMLDVLRILVAFNGAVWKSELAQGLDIMSSSGDGQKAASGWLDKVLEELERKGLVKVEEQIRATLQFKGGAEDELISLVDLCATSAALSKCRISTSKKRK